MYRHYDYKNLKFQMQGGWIKFLILCLYFGNFTYVYSQSGLSDCSGAIEVCGNGAISSNATGFGQQEISSNACSSFEHHSLWIRIEITRPGTLGFTLTPTSGDILVDYDFFVFGPDVSCGNLGNSIRCSTTNPNSAGQTNNLTGMNDTETDVAEGPGPNGNSFVKSLDVLPGETYYIVIDRPIGTSPFDLEWTGTATLEGSPFPEGVEASKPEDLVACASETPVAFDVFATSDEITDQPQTSIKYYSQLEDAVDQTNEITGSFSSSLPRKTIYVRVENSLTGCYEIVDFDLILLEGPELMTSLDYQLCDLDQDGTEEFYLSTQDAPLVGEENPDVLQINYFRSRNDAENLQNILPDPYTSAGETIFARVQEKEGLACFNIAEITLTIISPEELNEIDPESVGFKISSETIDFKIGDSDFYLFSLNDPSGPYQEETGFKNVPAGLNTIFIKARDRCAITTVEIVVPKYPAFFTPNADGHNDRWTVSLGNYPSAVAVRIFDRYGKILSSFKTGSTGWDGTFLDEDMPADDYWFDYTLPLGQKIITHFSLIR